MKKEMINNVTINTANTNTTTKGETAMKNIVLTRKGIGTIVLTQNELGYFMTTNGITTKMADANSLNQTYLAYRKAGWVVKPEKTEKKTSPKVEKKAQKPTQTREERLTEKYGDISVRREYMKKKTEIRLEVAEEIRQWTKTHRRLTKEEYKRVWNSEVDKRMSQWEAEKLAIC